MNIPDDLLPGDILLYKSSGVFGDLIALWTHMPFSHVEVFAGPYGFDDAPHSLASRDGVGVGVYPFRSEGLASVLRSNQPVNWECALAYFNTVKGEAYDWPGIADFVPGLSLIIPGGFREQFCSQFATRVCQAMVVHPFSATVLPEKVFPGHFWFSPELKEIWRDMTIMP